MKRSTRFSLMALLAVIIGTSVYAWQWSAPLYEQNRQRYGVSFSASYASFLGLDPVKTLDAILDELGVKQLRLMAYWNELAPTPDRFDWSSLDWQMDAVAKREGQIILALGERVPRWPECHSPKWTKDLNPVAKQTALLNFVAAVVTRYKQAPVIAWQVENETTLRFFGDCPPTDRQLFKEEIKLVRSLDSRPALSTASGELSRWAPVARLVDRLGVSLYRVTWNKFLGYQTYPLPPSWYRWRSWLAGVPAKELIIIEAQAEPWAPQSVWDLTLDQQARAFSPTRMEETIQYIRRTGLPQIYLWGAEWWAWQKEQGNEQYWLIAKKLFGRQLKR